MSRNFAISSSSDFEDAIERAQRPVLGFLIRLTGSVNDAHDLLQMTNVTAWTRKDSFEAGTDLVAWMRTIAINHARNESRRRSRQSTVMLLDQDLIEAAEIRHTNRSVANASTDLGDQQQDQKADLDRCLKKLTPAQRELIDQFYHQGLSLREIADQRNSKSNPNAIGQRLHRARLSLIDCVKRHQQASKTQTSLISR